MLTKCVGKTGLFVIYKEIFIIVYGNLFQFIVIYSIEFGLSVANIWKISRIHSMNKFYLYNISSLMFIVSIFLRVGLIEWQVVGFVTHFKKSIYFL